MCAWINRRTFYHFRHIVNIHNGVYFQPHFPTQTKAMHTHHTPRDCSVPPQWDAPVASSRALEPPPPHSHVEGKTPNVMRCIMMVDNSVVSVIHKLKNIKMGIHLDSGLWWIASMQICRELWLDFDGYSAWAVFCKSSISVISQLFSAWIHQLYISSCI